MSYNKVMCDYKKKFVFVFFALLTCLLFSQRFNTTARYNSKNKKNRRFVFENR